MDIRKLLKPYKQRLLWEGFIKALIVSLTIGASGVFITSFVYHILLTKTPHSLILYVGLSAFLLSFLLSFAVFFYPTNKKVADRIDGSGLKERAGTMLAYRNVNTEIAELQRGDAVRCISALPAKEVRLTLGRSYIIVCAVCICFAALMLVLPYDIFAFAGDEIISAAEQEEKIKALIEELREQVKASQLDEELKEDLNEIVDSLEEELEDAESELEMAARIEDAKEEMMELLEKAITKNKIGEALQKYELTQELGEAISDGDGEKVSTALDSLQASLTEDTSLVDELSQTVDAALSDSGVETADELYGALSAFAQSLAELDTSAEDFGNTLGTIFDTAEEAILSALEKQAAIENEMNSLEESMSDAKDEMLGREKEEETAGEMPEGEMSEGEMPEGEMPEGEMPESEMPEGGMPSDGSGEGTSTMTEGIYDPVSGSVSYGEVFAAYYAEYLAALEAGEVSEELQEIIDKYFSSLN